MIKGTGLSQGIAIGKILMLKTSDINITNEKIDNIEEELKKLDKYLNEVIKDTEEIVNTLEGQAKEIMDAHLLILQDPTLTEEAKRLINEEKYNVGYAIENGFSTVIKMFEAIDDEYLSARSRDIADLKTRVLEKVFNIKKVNLEKLPQNTIIITYELTTSDTAKLDFKNVAGIITEIGGATSHSCIMARTHEIPAISGIKDIYNTLKDKSKIAMNGDTGEIYNNPKPDKLLELSKLKKQQEKSKNDLEKYRGSTSETKDKRKVELFANIGNPNDAKTAFENDAEGIGLLRSEFLYMDSEELPKEEEQFNAYKKVAETMQGKEVIIRTLDIGGDKKLPYLETYDEANPFLGCRAVRLCLKKPEIFKTQLRALLRASAFGNIKIMFPMISSINELREAKKILEECKKELDKENISYNKDIKVGIMIEIPAAALNAKNFAKECDFFSIGTNDLIQYTIAVERGNEVIQDLYTKYNPGVIRLIKLAIEGAHEIGIPCGMCGEAAGNENFIPLLVGMGLDEFSMSSNNILKARKLISKLDTKECEKLVEDALNIPQAREVKALVREFVKNL